jgi:hypothetical protein
MARAHDGTAASADAVAMGRCARPLAELGWERARRAEASSGVERD